MVRILLPITMLLCGPLAAVRPSVSESTEYRLPVTVLPSHYTIRLVPYFEDRNFTFDGEVEITVNATTDASAITLHYDDMDIIGSPTVVSLAGFQELEVVNTTYDNITSFFRMELNETLRRGQEYLIHIKYVGNLNDDGMGFYRSYYNTSYSEKRYGLLHRVSKNRPFCCSFEVTCTTERAYVLRISVTRNMCQTCDQFFFHARL
jgi:hypothetical protein